MTRKKNVKKEVYENLEETQEEESNKKIGSTGKIITAIFLVCLIAAIALIGIFVYGLINPESQVLRLKNYNSLAETQAAVNASGELKQFVTNLRFNHNDISYYMSPDCSATKKTRFENALFLISDKTKIINFYLTNEKDADILVGCSKDSYEQEKNVFIAGEGGPTEYLDLKVYPVIKKGKVLLYEESNCDYPVTELHELLHVFGFDHINNSKLLLYPYIKCDQSIPPEAIEALIKLYSVQPAAELYFSNASAVKTGMYLNFKIQINNDGMIKAEEVVLEVYADDEKIEVENLKDIDFGTGQGFYVNNLKLPSANAKNIRFRTITSTNEFDKTDNSIELSV